MSGAGRLMAELTRADVIARTACPTCTAPMGSPCIGDDGDERKACHRQRWRLLGPFPRKSARVGRQRGASAEVDYWITRCNLLESLVFKLASRVDYSGSAVSSGVVSGHVPLQAAEDRVLREVLGLPEGEPAP